MTAKIFKKNKLVQPQGFTVVEALIAVAVTSIGLVAILGVTVYALSISRVSPDEVIAANLAQEGIEVIRNIRDTNLLEGVFWRENISPAAAPWMLRIKLNSTSTGSDLIIMTAPQAGGSALECTTKGDGNNCRLYLDSNGFYSHDNTGQPTKFHRLVYNLYNPGLNEVRIQSSVAWQDRQGNWRQTKIQNNLRQYDFDKVASNVKRFEWQDSGMTVECNALQEDDSINNCNITGGMSPTGEYHQNSKCGRCCLIGLANCDTYNEAAPLAGEFIYLAPFDDNPKGEDLPNVPAFYGDPVYVCDITARLGVTNYECRIFEKIEL